MLCALRLLTFASHFLFAQKGFVLHDPPSYWLPGVIFGCGSITWEYLIKLFEMRLG